MDLDSGRVGDANLPSADLAWKGVWFLRTLEAVCGARSARTGSTSFDGVSRATLYGFAYEAPNPIPVEELAQLDPFGLLFGGDLYRESLYVYGVHTNEGRWSEVQVVDVENDYIRLRYRTWEKLLPSVEITGAWQCESGIDAVVDPASVVFELSPALALAHPGGTRPPAGGTGTVTTSPTGGEAPSTKPPTGDPCAPLVASMRALVPADIVRQQSFEAVPLEDRRLGRWSGTVHTRAEEVARFDAVTQGFGPGLEVRWQINDKGVPSASGDMNVEGVSIHHETSGGRLVLRTRATEAFEFLLWVTAPEQMRQSALKGNPPTRRSVFEDPELVGVGQRGSQVGVVVIERLQFGGLLDVTPAHAQRGAIGAQEGLLDITNNLDRESFRAQRVHFFCQQRPHLRGILN